MNRTMISKHGSAIVALLLLLAGLLTCAICGCVPTAKQPEPAVGVANGRSSVEILDRNDGDRRQTQQSSGEGHSALQKRADQLLREIQVDLNRGGITQQIVQRLEAVRRVTPGHDPTNLLLSKLYVKKKDWNALALLIKQLPKTKRSAQHAIELAMVLVRANRFSEALELANSAVTDSGDCKSLEAAWVVAQAAFHTGDHDRAARVLDANLHRFAELSRFDPFVMRGLIHFQKSEFKAAESVLTKVVSLNDQHTKAHDTLGRVLFAAGDVDRGKRHLAEAVRLRKEFASGERKQLHLAATSRALQAAWAKRDLATCKRYIDELRPHVNAQQRLMLDEYLAEIRAARGRKTDSREAIRKPAH